MSNVQEGKLRFGDGMRQGRPEWTLDVRDALGLTGNFLHREMLACLALMNSV